MLNKNEIWKPIPEFEKSYEVSNLGRIRAIHGYGGIPEGYILKTHYCRKGYELVRLYKDNTLTNTTVHRCVAKAFIPNPTKKKTVNHIDGNKQNNSLENLEWATYSENHIHAFKAGLKTPPLNALGKKWGNSSKYHNVTYDSSRNRWIASVKHLKKSYVKRFSVKDFGDLAETLAALAVNDFIELLGLKDRPKNLIS